MRRRMGWRWPLLREPLLRGLLLWVPLVCSALLWVSGCTFPKSLGLARQEKPQPKRQVAEERIAPTAANAEAVGSPMMFAAASPKKTNWFWFHRDKPQSTDDLPLRDQDNRSQASKPRTSSDRFPPAGRPPEANVAPRVATAPRDAAAAAPKKTLAQSLRTMPSWLSFGRHKPKSTDDRPLVDTRVRSNESRQPFVDPHVVPPKYRNRGEGAPSPAVAKDTSGSPSLVRPSRRPPPDPAPAPPEDQPVLRAPVTEGILFDIIATASQSWRVKAGGPVAAATQQSSPRPLVTEPHLKFTAPDVAGRDRKTRSTPTDLVRNMLRPSHSASGAAGKPTSADRTGTSAVQGAAAIASQTPGTTWMAKKTPTSSTAVLEKTDTRPGQRRHDPVHPGTPADSAPSRVVAQTFSNAAGPQTAATQVPSGAAGKSETAVLSVTSPAKASTTPALRAAALAQSGERAETPSRSLPVSSPFVAPPAERSAAWPSTNTGRIPGSPTAIPDGHSRPASALSKGADPPTTAVANRGAGLSKPHASGAADRTTVEPKPAVPTVTLPDRSQVAARMEHASPKTPGFTQRAFVAKAPSQVHATAPTHAAAAPPVVAEEETCAPLVDAQTYRATLAGSSKSQPAPVYTAQRPPTPDLPGSWVTTYQQLMQGNPAPAVPRPPAGSPKRKLSSEDEPELPELPAPILRR